MAEHSDYWYFSEWCRANQIMLIDSAFFYLCKDITTRPVYAIACWKANKKLPYAEGRFMTREEAKKICKRLL